MFTLSYTYTHTQLTMPRRTSCLPHLPRLLLAKISIKGSMLKYLTPLLLTSLCRRDSVTHAHTHYPIPHTHTHTHATALQVQSAALPLPLPVPLPVRVVQLNAINMSNLIDAINFWAPCPPCRPCPHSLRHPMPLPAAIYVAYSQQDVPHPLRVPALRAAAFCVFPN